MSDAGDILAILRELGVELVLSGHRHVPYVNNVSNTLIVHCGTVSSTRVRGFMRPSYNRIELDGDEIRITLRYPGEGGEPLASGSWRTSFSTRRTSATCATTGYLSKADFRELHAGEVRRTPLPRARVTGPVLRDLGAQEVPGAPVRYQRNALVRLRNEGTISDEALHRIERDLDLEETRLDSWRLSVLGLEATPVRGFWRGSY